MLEHIPQRDGITASRLDMRGGMAHPPAGAGLGIDWDWPAIVAQTLPGSHSTEGGR